MLTIQYLGYVSTGELVLVAVYTDEACHNRANEAFVSFARLK